MAKPFRLIKNALLMPLEGRMDSFASGVFSNGECIPESLMSRAVPAVPAKPEAFLKGCYIFGGYLFGHYGHFLLESLSRCYAIRQCRSLPLLFMSPNPAIIDGQSNMFKFVGIGNEMRLIEVPTQVESLIVSPPGSGVRPDFILPEQLEALGRITISPATGNLKVWLSRSLLKGGGIENEPFIENALRNLGWHIAFPETLDLLEQISLIASASYVAGFDGSAFYTALLARKNHGHFCIFGRRNMIADTLTYMLTQKGVSKEEHIFPADHLTGEQAAARYVLREPERIIQVLEKF